MALKIPPLIILIIALLSQFELADYVPIYSVHPLPLWLTLLWAVAGLVIMILGITEFRRHQTTINPLTPSDASSLIQTGIFGRSRNPIYLGMACIVMAGVCYHGALSGLASLVFFVAYITYFQIMPEEVALEERFPQAFSDYKKAVRRWC